MLQLNCENKGLLPSFFNKENNWNYVGEFPPTSDYGCGSMKTEEIMVILDWYSQQVQQNKLFNLK